MWRIYTGVRLQAEQIREVENTRELTANGTLRTENIVKDKQDDSSRTCGSVQD